MVFDDTVGINESGETMTPSIIKHEDCAYLANDLKANTVPLTHNVMDAAVAIGLYEYPELGAIGFRRSTASAMARAADWAWAAAMAAPVGSAVRKGWADLFLECRAARVMLHRVIDAY